MGKYEGKWFICMNYYISNWAYLIIPHNLMAVKKYGSPLQ